jgi:hypothetical protein
MAAEAEASTAAGVEASTAADLVADSTEVASAGTTQAGVEPAGMPVGAVMAGVEDGAGTAGAAGVTRAGESVSALVGAGVGVPTGRVTRMPMAIPIITPTIHLIRTMGRPRMRQRTRIDITAATKILVTTRSGRIRAIPGRRDRLA